MSVSVGIADRFVVWTAECKDKVDLCSVEDGLPTCIQAYI